VAGRAGLPAGPAAHAPGRRLSAGALGEANTGVGWPACDASVLDGRRAVAVLSTDGGRYSGHLAAALVDAAERPETGPDVTRLTWDRRWRSTEGILET
jgi:hypothetical protein